ncbi:MAG: sensor histidine kinase [Candidatus Adiutrix sp.]
MNVGLSEATLPTHLPMTSPYPDDFWVMLFDQLPYLMLVFDQEGHLLLANDEATRRLDLSMASDFVLPERLKCLKAGAFQLEMRGSRSRTITMPSPADGNPINFTLRHLPYGEGLILATGHSLFSNDFSAGEDLVASTAAANAVGRQVTGPLAGIELYASIVGQELEEAGDSALADLIEQIRFGVREVNEYLTSFSSMSQPLTLDMGTHKLVSIIDEALGAMSGVFKERDIGVLVTQKDLDIEVDRGLLVQLMLNILLNAVEAMPSGGRIFVEFSVEKQGFLEIIVTDTGPGVPLTQMKRIFNPFFTTKDQPLGLGLPVSLRIAEAHGGRLLVGSDRTMGARAVLSLPYLPTSPEKGTKLN